jgi:hypothetical protein
VYCAKADVTERTITDSNIVINRFIGKPL